MAFAMASFIGLTFVLPLYLQGLRGLDPLAQRPDDVPAGDRHPDLVADRRPALPAGRAAPADHRRAVRRRRVDGLRCCSSASTPTCGGSASIMFLRGLRHGLLRSCPSQAASYAEIAPADNGRASAIFSTQRQMSVSIGIALMATVLASFTTLTETPTDPQRALDGYHWTFALCVALSLIGRVAGLDHDPGRRRPRDDAGPPTVEDRRTGPRRRSGQPASPDPPCSR